MRMHWHSSWAARDLPSHSSAASRSPIAAQWSANISWTFRVEDSLLVELKIVKELSDAHRAQCINYLKATGLHLCLLLNFSKPRLEIKRMVGRL